MMRLAVSIHLILEFWQNFEAAGAEGNEDNEDASGNDEHEDPPGDDVSGQVSDEIDEANMDDEDHSLDNSVNDDVPPVLIAKDAVEIASSLVNTCLTQLCK